MGLASLRSHRGNPDDHASPHQPEARIDDGDATADGSTRPRRGWAEAALRWSGALTLAGTVAMFAFLLVGWRNGRDPFGLQSVLWLLPLAVPVVWVVWRPSLLSGAAASAAGLVLTATLLLPVFGWLPLTVTTVVVAGSRLVRSVAHRREQADARPGP